MRNDLLWEKINNELNENKVEIKTLGRGLWFSAISVDGNIYIDKAIENKPSCNISSARKITERDFLFVHSYYERWKLGVAGIRHEVSRKSRNTAYIFALIEKYLS